jgi:hypothetical protein
MFEPPKSSAPFQHEELSGTNDLHFHLLFRPSDATSTRPPEPVPTLRVICVTQIMEAHMGFGRGALLWLLGIPLPIIILLALFWR